ncbi:Gfo/Idh/MocA family protein [Nonomuraea typhae]|uniref:Gfo/Idh/MocA family protein n=1 Tax=Nonomuraea typhae TaxID=2603600 RepID=A0ABW7YL30_9ACTN
MRWGIAATGGIAQTVGRVIAGEPGMRVAAVASRSKERAAALGRELGSELAFGSYAELCAADEVDAVFVATPHAQHLEVAEAAIAHGKAVLCEKPLTGRLDEAERMVALAREAGVFLMEAMNIITCPCAGQRPHWWTLRHKKATKKRPGKDGPTQDGQGITRTRYGVPPDHLRTPERQALPRRRP